MEPERNPDTLPEIQPLYYYLENGEQFILHLHEGKSWKHFDYEANRSNPTEIRLISLDKQSKIRLVGKRVATPNPDGSIYRYKIEPGPSQGASEISKQRPPRKE